jgi:hypothetical protein
MLVQHTYRGIFVVYSRCVNKYVLYARVTFSLPGSQLLPPKLWSVTVAHETPRRQASAYTCVTSRIAEMSEWIVDVEDEKEITDGFV